MSMSGQQAVLAPVSRFTDHAYLAWAAVATAYAIAFLQRVSPQSVSLNFMYYNFVRRHQTLRMPPALKAHVSDHVWSLEEIINLTEK